MEKIQWAIELGASVNGNTPEELFPILEYYYKQNNHLKTCLIASLLLEMDLLPNKREEVELKLCVSAYYAGLHKIGKKYADKLLLSSPENVLYKENIKHFDSFFNRHYDYCLYLWPTTYKVFIDVVRALKWNLEQQDNTVIISENLLTNAKNTVIFGANNSIYNTSSINIPKKAIIYNFEQLYDDCHWDNPQYLNILKDREIWDYSLHNINWLQKKGLGKSIKHMKINYAPTLEFKSKIFPDFEDIDVLFIGSINDRRQLIIKQLKELAPHLNIIFTNNIWGIPRNELIARSKIILNIHYYLTGILETPRISQIVANNKFIISELSNPNDELDWPGIIFVPYNEIVNTVLHYSQKPNERIKLAKKAYNHFKSQKNN
ncbi:DNA-binding protein [Bacillus wiedmannii]|uniref:DNA-binding protein n=1 Tax=Bacillus wiedmannii TaxID=1890302 RepID=UPI000BF0C8DD|nr:DNA-binding protein [Bacillus wiedmannii]PEJ66375.1 DNA-binding protein [Bacillus wiedmannii]